VVTTIIILIIITIICNMLTVARRREKFLLDTHEEHFPLGIEMASYAVEGQANKGMP
jgi:hypothetical protein